MSLRIKILSVVIAINISLSMLLIGVFALNNANFNVQGSISFTAKIEIKQDTDKNYQYVEMGSYEGVPMRWKYVGYVAEDGTYTKHDDPNTAPTNTGIFIQESGGNTRGISWNNEYIYESGANLEYHHAAPLTDVAANDYSTSNIRKFLNGETVRRDFTGSNDTQVTPSGVLINILDMYNLRGDAIYNKITGRSLSDLYKNIAWDGNTTLTTLDVPTGAQEIAGGDKLWLMSAEEIYTIVGGGDAIQVDWSAYYDNIKWNPSNTGPSILFWLRSSDSGRTGFARPASSSGRDRHYVSNPYAARAAFLLEI